VIEKNQRYFRAHLGRGQGITASANPTAKPCRTFTRKTAKTSFHGSDHSRKPRRAYGFPTSRDDDTLLIYREDVADHLTVRYARQRAFGRLSRSASEAPDGTAAAAIVFGGFMGEGANPPTMVTPGIHSHVTALRVDALPQKKCGAHRPADN